MKKQAHALGAVEKARHAFFVDGEMPADLLPDHVLASWQRCRALGLSSRGLPMLAPAPAPELRHLLDRDQPLMRAAEQEFRMLSDGLRDTGHVVYLVDDQGFIVLAGGDIAHGGTILRHAQQGINLGEQNFGTTAPGAALQTGMPVSVKRGQHFFTNMCSMECVAVPIFLPGGDVVGVLGVSSEARALMPGIMDLVQNSMASIERCLLQALRSAWVLHAHPRPDCLGTTQEGLIALDEDSLILGLNTVAARLFGIPQAAAVGRPLEDFVERDSGGSMRRTERMMHMRARNGLGLYATLEKAQASERQVLHHEARCAAVPATPCLLEPFTEQERKVLACLARGLRNQDIGRQLCVSENTVKFHLKNIFSKLAVGSRTEAMVAARQLGLDG